MTDRVTLAVDAVRGTTTGEETGAACYTRARVLALVRQRKRRRVLNVTFGIPLAAVLMGSVAWAASDQHLTVMVQYLSTALTRTSADHTPPARSAAPRQAARSAANRLQPQSASAIVTVPSTIPLESKPSAAAPQRSTKRAASPVAALATHASSIVSDAEMTERELLLYERAHRAHFVEKSWAAALGGWDEYLRRLPRGRFAVEARYNRALCLVRLGKAEQALNALRPFAQASAGSYRQREARELIEQLDQRAP